MARQAGFTDQGAVIMTAIAGAESGYDDADLGDVGLENETWGPSYGLFQVRTQKSATGTGGDRDQTWLAASDLNQAKAAYAISSGGTNFGPWTTYTSGKYQSFLSGAKAAASSVGANLGSFVDGLGDALTNPLGAAQSAATSTLDAVITPLLEGGKQLGFTAGFAALGGLLLIGGLVVFVYPHAKKNAATVAKVAGAAI
ncbi:hypothetical protein [Fodinicola feengrottensis]|uniref:hypothetical protein n=1 Tax=Fodinicola feengrottensis TaxID=435914 RepID=UPI0024433F81|nr:hypothetical protein [Fodinicola feengrottensis]